MAVATDLWMLFAARVLGGVLSSATLPTAMAYIGDTTSHHNRGAGMGILGAAMGMGVIFGPGIGGMLASFGMAAPFYFAAASAALILAFAYFTLPESLPKERRTTSTRAQSPQERIVELLSALRGPMAAYFGLALITSFGMANLESVFAYFASDKFGYGPREMGVLFFALGVVSVIVQGVAVGRLLNRFGEERVVLAGLVFGGVGFGLLTLAFDMVSLLVFLSVNAVGVALLRPGISTLLSKRTPAGQGTTMGLQGSFDSLGRIVGPVWGGLLYVQGMNLPYYSAAIVFLLGLLLLVISGVGPLPVHDSAAVTHDHVG
jgi:DHA1 family multidrug resistance protein-like MFS transporter